MTTEELAELFLVALYDLAEAAPHPYFLFSVNEFAPTMGVTDLRELSKAMVHLESRGLTFSASMDAIGGISAGITPDGTAYVENGGETGIIGRYRENPAAFRVEVERPLPPVEQATVRSVDPPPAGISPRLFGCWKNEGTHCNCRAPGARPAGSKPANDHPEVFHEPYPRTRQALLHYAARLARVFRSDGC